MANNIPTNMNEVRSVIDLFGSSNITSMTKENFVSTALTLKNKVPEYNQLLKGVAKGRLGQAWDIAMEDSFSKKNAKRVQQGPASTPQVKPARPILDEAQIRQAEDNRALQKFLKDNNLEHMSNSSTKLAVNDDHSMRNFQKRIERLEKRLGSRQEALESIAKKYDIPIEYDNAKRSMMDRILGRNKYINEDAVFKGYRDLANEQVDKMVKAGLKTEDIGRLSEHGPKTKRTFERHLEHGGPSG